MLEPAPSLPPADRLAPGLAPPDTSDPLDSDQSPSLRTRAARGTLINTGFTAALGLLGVLKSFILAGFVSRSVYGDWGVLVVTLGTLLWIKQVGIGDKFIQQTEDDQEAAFQKAFTLELGFSGGLSLLMIIATPLVVVIYGLPKLILPGIVIAASLMISVFQAPLWVYYRRMQFGRQRALAAIDPVVEFVVSISLAAAGAGIWAFVGGLAAGVTAASLAAVWRSPFRLALRYDHGTFRSYVSFSGPLLLASGASLVMTWAAMIATKLSLGTAALGVVTLSGTIAAFADQADQLVTGSLYPAICAVRDRTELLYESFIKTNRLALMWAVPFGIGAALFAGDVVRFGIGERWRPAVVVLEVQCGFAALNHVGFNWTAYFRARGRTRPMAIANAAAAAVFILAGIPLLLAFGLPGFAVGVALQCVAGLIVRWIYIRQLFPGFDFLLHAARAFLPTIPAASAVLLLRAGGAFGHGIVAACTQLVLYVLITTVLTWYLESGLLREALAVLQRGGVAAAGA